VLEMRHAAPHDEKHRACGAAYGDHGPEFREYDVQ
jgi:hypothetical protein